MKNQGTVIVEVVVIAAVVALLGLFGSKIHIPFLTTKADVQKKLDTEKQAHQLTKDELVSQSNLTAEQKALLDNLNKAAQEQAKLTQSAANSVAKITAVFELSLPANRKEIVISYASQEAAQALPAPTEYAAILKIVKDELDEMKTTNAQLAAQHKKDLEVIDVQKADLAKAQIEVAAQQQKVDEQTALNVQQKADNDRQRKELDAKEGLLNQAMEAFNRLKYAIMGLVGLAGMLCIGAGVVVNNRLLIAKGVLLIVIAVLGMIIPITWYLVVVGVALLAVVVYVASQWHKEKTIAENATAILQETRQKAPEVWVNTIKPIAGEYWGTGVKDVAKAQKWVTQKLYDLNFLKKDDKP